MRSEMSATGIAKPGSMPVLARYNVLHRIVRGAALLLCVFGTFVSVGAMFRVLIPHQPPTGIDAFFEYPLWGVLHFVPGLLFMTLVPLQLWPAFRNRHRVFHRWSGRLLVTSGLFLGLSGVTFPFLMQGRQFSERIAMSTFFAFFLFFLIKAFAAARRRDFVQHREWMIRWFGIGLAITTQRVLLITFVVSAGGVTDPPSFWEIFVSAAWLSFAIQALIAEWWITTTRLRQATLSSVTLT